MKKTKPHLQIRDHSKVFVISISLFLTLLTSGVMAFDKSGVKANKISLPKGPGSIKGLGESFQPNLNTGSAKYAIPFSLPKGVNSPEVGLSYSGGRGNGVLGLGWSLHEASIQRQTDKGIPRYIDENNGVDDDFDGLVDEHDELDVFLENGKEELIPVEGGYYFSKINGDFIRYQKVEDYWVGNGPDGTRLFFGETANSRIEKEGKIFKWFLEREVDLEGNEIIYQYSSFSGEENSQQKYLRSITYGRGSGDLSKRIDGQVWTPFEVFYFVSFDYEERNDVLEDCTAGFPIRTGRRLKSVHVGCQGWTPEGHLSGDFFSDGISDFLIRKYDVTYEEESHWSLLKQVIPYGADGVTSLPSAKFSYGLNHLESGLELEGESLGVFNEPIHGIDNHLVDLVDMNGDGLPDLLKTGDTHQVYYNLGEVKKNGQRAIEWAAPVTVESEDQLAYNIDLESSRNISNLVDMDGDGLSDLVYKTLDDQTYYFKNLGSGKWGARQKMSNQNYAPPAPYGDPDVKTGDFNFDKKMDLVKSINVGGTAYYQVWYNLGEEGYSERVTYPQSEGMMFSQSGVHLADINGDRLPDILRLRNSSVEVLKNLGYGKFLPKETILLPDTTLTDDQIAKGKFQDISGDGLVDLVIERAEPGTLWYWMNQGDDQFYSKRRIRGLPSGVGMSPSIRWVDLNGNGTVDLVYSDSQTEPKIQIVDIGVITGCGASTNMLTEIYNGIGGRTKISYSTSTEFIQENRKKGIEGLYALPFPIKVVSKVVVDDSMGHEYLTKYHYYDGYYDGMEKEFRGFSKVKQVNLGDDYKNMPAQWLLELGITEMEGEVYSPSLVSESMFHVGKDYEAMKGKIKALRTETLQGETFSEVFTSWEYPPRVFKEGVNGSKVVWAVQKGSQSIIKEKGQGTSRILKSESDVDSYGNTIKSTSFGIVENGDPSAFDDEVVNKTEYIIDEDRWILRAVKSQEVRDENGVLHSRQENFYDDETFTGTNLGDFTKGRLTMTRSYEVKDGALTGDFINTLRTQYDEFGNPKYLIDPLGEVSEGEVQLNQGHLRELRYDPLFHLFPTEEIIHVGDGKEALGIKVGYNLAMGTMAFSKNTNGHEIRYSYDTFGRLKTMIKPGDQENYPSLAYDYVIGEEVPGYGLINYVETRALRNNPGELSGIPRDHYVASRTYTDGLGRTVATRSDGEKTGQIVVSGMAEHTRKNEPFRQYLPYFEEDSSLDFKVPELKTSFSELYYDALGRPIRVVKPANSEGKRYFSKVVYEPLAQISFDEEQTDPSSKYYGCSKKTIEDGMLNKKGKGRLREVIEMVKITDEGEESAEIQNWVTKYSYNIFGKMTGYEDAQGNTKVLDYDGYGRKSYMNDPDRGEMFYLYDKASNLIQSKDSKKQVIQVGYDGVNRITSEHYLTENQLGQALGQANVSYIYDTPLSSLDMGDGTRETPSNVKGMLAYVKDESGEEHTSYDARGRVQYVVKRIPDLENQQLCSYTTRFEYDEADKLTKVRYPDNDEIFYDYDFRGVVDRIYGTQIGDILSDISYIPTGQIEELFYGNGVTSKYGYDYLQRLSSIRTAKTSDTAKPHVAFDYEYDGVSNITKIIDQRPETMIEAGNQRRNHQLFQYDSLYRLTQVQYQYTNGPFLPSEDKDQISYRYNRIGNMIAKTSNIEHLEKGLSVTDIGTMTYGGNKGCWNRKLTLPNQGPSNPLSPEDVAPGTHALTGCDNGQVTREYSYDSNGNMTTLHGYDLEWDTKDRLKAVENDDVRAEYSYDFTGRRITKKVYYKEEGKELPEDLDTFQGKTLTTTYVGKHFEIREGDQPTKYVFNGDTRVARITGTLSNVTNRLQRFRIKEGVNLLSISVNAPDALAQLGLGSDSRIENIVLWDSENQTYQTLSQGDALPGGSVFWLKSTSDMFLNVRGEYHDPDTIKVPAGFSYIPAVGLEAVLMESNSNASLQGAEGGFADSPSQMMMYDTENKTWLHDFSVNPEVGSNLPQFLAPGQAVFVNFADETELEIPDPKLHVKYYHQNHLGSSSVITDSDGELVEEVAYYPYGTPRHEYQPRGIKENYKFTQKERDIESGLHYFEARYYAAPLGQFITVDPAQDGLNLYAYCGGRPLNHIDPSGCHYEYNGVRNGWASDLILQEISKIWNGRTPKLETIEFLKIMRGRVRDFGIFFSPKRGVSSENTFKKEILFKALKTNEITVKRPFFLKDTHGKASKYTFRLAFSYKNGVLAIKKLEPFMRHYGSDDDKSFLSFVWEQRRTDLKLWDVFKVRISVRETEKGSRNLPGTGVGFSKSGVSISTGVTSDKTRLYHKVKEYTTYVYKLYVHKKTRVGYIVGLRVNKHKRKR